MSTVNQKVAKLLMTYREDHVMAIEHMFSISLDEQQRALVRGASPPISRVAVKSCQGAGKAKVNGEPVLGPEGPTAIQDLKIGDTIFNTYGSTSKVEGVYPQGPKDCYRVHFNDGRYSDCSIDHLWSVSDRRGTKYKTLSLEEILDNGIRETSTPTDRNAKGYTLRYKVPNISPVVGRHQEYNLDPYVLGVWLGDGSRNTPIITNIDEDLWDILRDKGYRSNKCSNPQSRYVSGLIGKLRTLKVLDKYSYEKSIPSEYLNGSREDRLGVMQGLMDTDGTIDKKGRTTYYTTSPDLARDFLTLVRSLGCFSKGIKTKETTHRDCYAIHFRGEHLSRVFKIERKEERRILDRKPSYTFISSVEYIGKLDCTCITVDSKDSLFLTRDFLPTHNTATLVWLTMLYLLILEDCRVLVTAPSAQQLNRVYHSEFEKWHHKLNPIFKPFFDIKKETINIKGIPFQMASLVTGNPSNMEGLQGGHSKNYVVMCDEASGLDEIVFDTLQGTLGAGFSKMILTSNPVRNSGRFYEIFTNNLKMWERLTFTANGSAQIQDHWIEEMAEMHGVDSDNYQIRVLGNFGRFGEQQFIPSYLIEGAAKKFLEYKEYVNYPKVAGVDIARYGDDSTVLVLRQGPKILDITKYKGLDTMEVSARVVDYHHQHSPSLIYFDAIGVGAGVYDRCTELGLPTKEVIVSHKSSKPQMYGNLRAQIWGEMKDWINNGADIPNDSELISQLNSMQYTYNQKMQIMLMGKKDIKRMGLPSPDIPDAISLTFADVVYQMANVRASKRNIKRNHYHWI